MLIPKSFCTDKVIEMLKGKGVESILECGCSSGYNLYWLKRKLKVKIAGCDRYAPNDLLKFPFKLIDLKDGKLNYPDKNFDVVLWAATLYMIPGADIRKALMKESKRVARKYIVICDMHSENRPDPWWDYTQYFNKKKIKKFTISGWPNFNSVTDYLLIKVCQTKTTN